MNKKKLTEKLNAFGVDTQGLIFLKKTASTFDVPADIVVAASQTSGIGRINRNFFSPKGGIYFCIKITALPLMTISVAAGIMRAMEAFSLKPAVKWVNDILLDGKKVCGILCKGFTGASATIINENNDDNKAAAATTKKTTDTIQHATQNTTKNGNDNSVEYFATAGIGINYCIKKFPDFIKTKAASLFNNSKGINEFAALAIKEVLSACRQSKAHENLLFYRERLAGLVKEIVLPDGSNAVMTGVDDDGSLMYTKNGKHGHIVYGDICL